MSNTSKYILVLLYIVTLLQANVDDDIQAIQNASPEERFKLMNAFKKNLIKMNENERINALTKLGKKSNKKSVNKALKVLKIEHRRKQLRKKIEQQQIDTENIASETEDFNGGDNDNE